MNWEKAKNNLDKINLLWQNIRMSENDLSPLERDLMLSYLRRMYECFVPEAAESSTPVRSETPSTPKPQNPVQPTPVMKDIALHETTPSVQAQPVAVNRPVASSESPKPMNGHYHQEQKAETPVYQPAERQEEIPHPPVRPQVAPVIQSPVYANTYREEAAMMRQTVSAPPEPVRHETSSGTPSSQAVLRLFDQAKASDLSEKLSQLPISDLTRAFAVNERILIINELFGGDSVRFVDTIRQLNSLQSFSDAKTFLVREVAMANHWANDEKAELASSFIRLVRRKYPSV